MKLENIEPNKIEITKEENKFTKHLGTMKLKPGHKIYSYDLITGVIEEAKIQKSDVYGIPSKINAPKNKVYLQFLNLKNAKRKFLKKLISIENKRKKQIFLYKMKQDQIEKENKELQIRYKRKIKSLKLENLTKNIE